MARGPARAWLRAATSATALATASSTALLGAGADEEAGAGIAAGDGGCWVARAAAIAACT